MILYLLFSDGILTMFGGTVNDETFRLSKEYFFYITLGIPFYMFGQGMNPVIRADGSPKFAMVSTLAGAVINIILDPIFIFGFKWGMMGAALATVIGQIATAVLTVLYIIHMKIIKPLKADFGLNADIVKRTLVLGVTSFLSQISLVAAMAAINNMIRKYGAMDVIFGQAQYAQIPMAVVGIVMKFFQIVISIVVGMAAGCIPVVGYNMGAGLKDRVKRLFTALLIAEASVGAAALVIVEVFPQALIGIFGAANESTYYTEFAIKAFRIYLCMMVFACVNKACFIFLQAMGKALVPMPVIGIPMHTTSLGGRDSLYSIVQMPSGIPVATVAINGGANAGLLAAKILATSDEALLAKLKDYSKNLKEAVQKKDDKLQEVGYQNY